MSAPDAGHYIEETVKVYLRMNEDGTAWEIDPTTFDGYPLDSTLENGPEDSECQCELTEDGDYGPEHQAVLARAEELDLPDAYQLSDLLNRYREEHR